MSEPPIVVYTDGACLGNPGPGGWAWAVPGGAFAAGAQDHTTNQRMEITAALEALRANGDDRRGVEVVSDSTYVVNCFRDRWWEGWIRRGWINSQRKPVANRDLWEPLIDLVRRRDNVSFRWVKGHSGDPHNDLVDRLAVEAAEAQAGRAGSAPPPPPARADERTGRTRGESGAGGPAGPGPERPDGHLLVVMGLRPRELGGYDDNPMSDAVRSRLSDVLAAKAQMHDDLAVVSGLRLGAEMLGAEAALALGVDLIVVLPYPEPDRLWPPATRIRFSHLVERARDVIVLQKRSPTSKAKAVAALGRRDAWLARTGDEAVVVWDGSDPAVGRLVRSLEDHLGDDVWIIDPADLAVAPPPAGRRRSGSGGGARNGR